MIRDRKPLMLLLENMQVYQDHIKEEVKMLKGFIDIIDIRLKEIENTLKEEEQIKVAK